MRYIYKSLFLTISLLLSYTVSAEAVQQQQPAHWSYTLLGAGDGSYKYNELKFEVELDKGWHMYAPYQSYKEGNGPTAAIFTFKPDKRYKLGGKLTESKAIKVYDDIFEVDVCYFEDKATFIQKIHRQTAEAFKVTGTISYQVCSNLCSNFDEKFEFDFPANPNYQGADVMSVKTSDTATKVKVDTAITISNPTDTSSTTISSAPIGKAPVNDCDPFTSFWYGLVAGFAALLAPCIFSMLPLTTSFFVKQSKTKSAGIKKAALYGFFIIVIFDVLGLLFGNLVYGISSHPFFNLFLFVLFMIFSFSFFGAFEITLPNAVVNKADKASDKGGIVGIFFMALTLALVSFSCTVPFVAGLITLVNSGNILCPLMGFTGFGFCLSLPFVLFAMFPAWLQSLPKSGGWMNTVKVTLGFLEIALALKFFSNADLVAGWHLVSRELFIAVWIVCFGLMGIYLLGLIKFEHDDKNRVISVPRAIVAICALSFTLYLIPGLWGAPVNLIAGFPPPLTAEWSENVNLYDAQQPSLSDTSKVKKNHSARCPKGLDNCFHDYNEGLAYAKQVDKPVMIDFTGWTCVNCRKMEQNVWSDPEVLKRIRDQYVLVSLYVDDSEKLSEKDVYTNKDGREINTVGKKWQDFQLSNYGVNAQPYYVLVDHNGKSLVSPVGYTPNIEDYLKFLDMGLVEFKKKIK